jgi:membrane-associated phospholipid phosphatase
LLKAPTWQEELRHRLFAVWFWKALATTAGISAFFFAYFWVMRNPLDAVATMPLTALDHLIPIEPAAMPLYLSLWFYVSLTPALLRDGPALARYGLACFVLSALGLLIFLLWPSATPDFGVDWSRYPSMMFLKSVDTSGNACPSLHVAFAVFSGLWLNRLLRDIGLGTTAKALNFLWCIGIVYSTVAVRQHVALDVAAGAGLGALVAFGFLAAEAQPQARSAATRPKPGAGVPAVSAAAPSPTARAAGR